MPKSDKYICTPKMIAFSAFIMLFMCTFAVFIATLSGSAETTTVTTKYIPTHATFDANSTTNSTILNATSSAQWGAIPGIY